MNLRVLIILLLAVHSALAQTSTLYTVENNGPRAKRINFVFFSEGYTTADMPSFAGHVTAAMNYLFSREPWQQYRTYCNVFRIEIASNQSGTDYGTAGVLKDTRFGSGFNNVDVPQLVTIDSAGQSAVYDLLREHVPEYTILIVLVNDAKYGGSGGPIAVVTTHPASAMVVEHEIGHSFAGLADEYDANYTGYTPSEMPNNTAQTNRSLIRWNIWIDAATPVATPETAEYDSVVGLFEGSMYRTTGWYRPHNNSLMRNLNRPVGNVNREQFVRSIYARVQPVDVSTPATSSFSVTTPQRIFFNLTSKQTTTGSVATRWFINEQLVSGANGVTFDVASDALGNGTHTIRAETKDATTFVRTDPPQRLKQNISWTVTLTNQLPTNLSSWRAAYGADLANPAHDGFVNLAKYALVVDPTSAIGVTQRPFVTLTPGAGNEQYLTLNIPRRTRRTHISYDVQISQDLAAWNSGAGYTVTLEDRDDLLVVRDATPVGVGPNRSMRLRVLAP